MKPTGKSFLVLFFKKERLASASRAWRAERRRRQAVLADLLGLDARDLHDLGISRYDFVAIAQGEFER